MEKKFYAANDISGIRSEGPPSWAILDAGMP